MIIRKLGKFQETLYTILKTIEPNTDVLYFIEL